MTEEFNNIVSTITNESPASVQSSVSHALLLLKRILFEPILLT